MHQNYAQQLVGSNFAKNRKNVKGELCLNQCCRVGVGCRSGGSRRFLRGIGVRVEKRILPEPGVRVEKRTLPESESKIIARLPTSSVAQNSSQVAQMRNLRCALCLFFSSSAICIALYAFFFSACAICVCESINLIIVAL